MTAAPEPIAWLVRYGPRGEYAAVFIDQGRAMQACQTLMRGTLEPLIRLEDYLSLSPSASDAAAAFTSPCSKRKRRNSSK